jgi:hypothetical protein
MKLLLLALLVGVPTAGPKVTQRFERIFFDEGRGSITGLARAEGGGFYAVGTLDTVEGPADCIVVKYDDKGRSAWRKTLGEAKKRADICHGVQPMGAGALVAGYTTATVSRQDAWVFAVDASGRMQWKVIHGGNGHDQARAAIPYRGDHVIAVGSTASKGAGATDGWIILIDPKGGVLKDWTIGDTGYDVLRAAAETPDGGLITVGESPPDGDLRSRPDAWAVKLDKDANIQWQKRFGTPARETATAVVALDDGSMIVAGSLGKLKDGKPVAPDGHGPRADQTEGWFAQLDASGEVLKELRLGYIDVRGITDVRLLGSELVATGTIAGDDGSYDGWVAALGIDMQLQWTHRIGGEHYEYPLAVTRTEGDVVVVGGWFDRKNAFNLKPWLTGFTTQ